MKIITAANGSQKVSMNQAEWVALGKVAHWQMPDSVGTKAVVTDLKQKNLVLAENIRQIAKAVF